MYHSSLMTMPPPLLADAAAPADATQCTWSTVHLVEPAEGLKIWGSNHSFDGPKLLEGACFDFNSGKIWEEGNLDPLTPGTDGPVWGCRVATIDGNWTGVDDDNYLPTQ